MLSDEHKKVFDDLKKPTMELIGAFYPMAHKIEMAFLDMLAVCIGSGGYETEALEKVLSRPGKVDYKLDYLHQMAMIYEKEQPDLRQKYIVQKQHVPMGVMTSGQFLVKMGIVSKEEKECLMEAQAAVRTIDGSVNVKEDYRVGMDHLDKPFATRMQRMEHIVQIVQSEIQKGKMSPAEMDIQNQFVKKCQSEAVWKLGVAGEKLMKKNQEIGKKIADLMAAIGGDKGFVDDKDFNDLLDCYKEEANHPNSEGSAYAVLKKRIGQIRAGDLVMRAKMDVRGK